MSTDDRNFQATVADNADPDQLGRLSLVIPGLFGDDAPHPDWIEPLVPGGAGADAVAVWWIPPVDAVVNVERDATGLLRWSGGTWGGPNTPPAIMLSNYGRRAGMTSPEGAVAIVLDEDSGVILIGSAIVLTSSETAPVEPLPLMRSFLTDLATFLTGCVGDAAMSPGVASAAGTLLAKVTSSLSAGSPYLSSVSSTA